MKRTSLPSVRPQLSHHVPPRARRLRASLVALCASAALASCASSSRVDDRISPMAGKRAEGQRGMVAASHPDAAAAGAQILAQGGNAVDAFVATAFALSVTDISQTGLGGGGAMTYYNAKTRRAEHLSFYPRSGADPAWARPEPAGTRAVGRAAATPGMVAGLLEAHAKWGKLTRAQVMAPAMRLAREGFIVSPLLARTIASSRAKLQADAEAAALFLPNGQPLRPGDLLVQPQLAATFDQILAQGRDGFYRGRVAEALAGKVQSLGGLISAGDMAAYPVASMRPLCAPWRQFTVLGAPPPMGGAVVLQMLQMAEYSGVATAGGFTNSPEAVVRMADIMRLGNADGYRWRGDPFSLRVPARGMTHPTYAQERAQQVGAAMPDTARAGNAVALDSATVPSVCQRFEPYPASVAGVAPADAPADAAEGESFTSHLAVVDAEGNAVSATTTVGVLFGSGVYTGGFFLNSSASNFDARTRGVNRYANSTMSPTVILEGDKVRLVIGAAGSQYIQPAITQVTLRTLAFGEDPFVAIAAPRIHASANSTDVEVEPGFTSAVYQALVARGYKTVSRVADITFGGVHGVYVAPNGRRIGIADPRRDGVAVGN
ncbi:gamma-glutamyltransferase family protein [Gemmatimonas sp. UBA7669]|uniref:gamma-glutamyltransferase family protein n=1 Tax=Gemmatimonas sp. UBA7669 TaxID=1946568 RepID=UPI0025B832B9|nr:gamma-glutamyltransferase [Gemmatimonas sp. UBA7669]